MNEIIRAALTPSEARVADLLLGGFPNKDIAEKLGLHPRTVKDHIGNMSLKFQAFGLDGHADRIVLVRKLLCA
jgi:DNA-binding NarL/FixJ family response regulator